MSAVYCHCANVFKCEPATSEGQDQNGLWIPLCERCMQIAFDAGIRVRKLQRTNYIGYGGSVAATRETR